MKLNIPIDSIRWDHFRNLGIASIIVIIFCIMLLYNIKLRKKKGIQVSFKYKLMTTLFIIGIHAFLIMYASMVYHDLLYLIDINQNSETSKEIVVSSIDYHKDSCKVYSESEERYLIRHSKYGVLEYKDIYLEIEEDFLMHKCEIQYLERSKRIISITLIE